MSSKVATLESTPPDMATETDQDALMLLRVLLVVFSCYTAQAPYHMHCPAQPMTCVYMATPKNDSRIPLACLLRDLAISSACYVCKIIICSHKRWRNTVWTVQQLWQAERTDRAGAWDRWCLTITLLLKANWMEQSIHILIINSEILLSASIDCCVL